MTENSVNFRPELKCKPPIDTQTNNKPYQAELARGWLGATNILDVSPYLRLGAKTWKNWKIDSAAKKANRLASDMTENNLNFLPELK